ncbi:hypothetical protein ERJ75_001461600 [Trypanosoma vivax]|nr:hypothetical protein ERJ75_001461600 [Trypanosoma vivax]
MSADCAPILRVLPLVQRSLKTSATVPSHELLLDILDVASVPCAGDVEIIHCGLNVFYTVAPYAVVSTMILEKVLVLLVPLAAYRPRDPLGMNVLDLILCRFQYVALNTPAAVATMCELFGRLSCCFGTSERDSAKTDIKSFSSEDCHSLSISMTERTERLLWRCIVEAARVDCALLEEALLLVGINALSAVQRGCLHFLLRGRHKQPQYDPPFLQFGQQLDVVIMKLRHGASEHRSFVQQLASMMEAQGSVGAFVPWRRAMLFIPEVTRDSSGEHARLSLLVAILKQSLESNTSRNNVGHYLWRQALVAIGKCHESNEAVVNAVAVALRTIHTVRPHGQWKPALVLTQRLSAAAHMPSTTLPGSWWWTSAGAVGFHTMRYLVESCDVCGIPLSMLIAFLKHIERHHEKKSLLDGKVVLVDEKIPSEGRHANVLGRAKVVADFTSGLQRHPYLNWVVALDALRLLLSVERDLLSSCENSAYAAKKNQNSGSAQRILCNSRDTFIKSIVTRLYKQHAYEPLLRFVEASQHLTSSRVGGKDMISMLNRLPLLCCRQFTTHVAKAAARGN